MSRCSKWNGTYNHIANYLIDKKNIKSNKAFGLTKKLVYGYTNSVKFEGSFSDRVMYVRDNYNQFINYLQNNLVD